MNPQVCIAGGGPAGMMLGLLLARAGVRTLVLEKHADFLRDFRGDTIHPSTLELMYELGLLEEFLKRRHQQVKELRGQVVGVRVTTPQGQREVRANLTIGADGRHSVIRQRAGLPAVNLGAPMDVMWMRLSRSANDPGQTFGYIDRGRLMVLLNREDYWQAAFVIPKGAADEIRQRGLPAFREQIASLVPFLRDRVDELRDWK